MTKEEIIKYLKDVIELESEKIMTETLYEELATEKEEWIHKSHYKAIKRKSNISLVYMIYTALKIFGISFVFWLVAGLFIDKISNLLLSIIAFILMVVSLFIAPIIVPVYSEIKEIRMLKKEFEKNKQKEIDLKKQSKNAIYIVNVNQNKLKDVYKHLNDELDRIYSCGVIYVKYQTLEACTAFLEYLESGRCDRLEGPYGAYNKFDTESYRKQSISNLQGIKMRLDIIISNQNRLEIIAMKMSESIEDMKKDIKNICATTKNIETISLEIAENTKISAWSSTVLATQVADYQSEAIRQTNKI